MTSLEKTVERAAIPGERSGSSVPPRGASVGGGRLAMICLVATTLVGLVIYWTVVRLGTFGRPHDTSLTRNGAPADRAWARVVGDNSSAVHSRTPSIANAWAAAGSPRASGGAEELPPLPPAAALPALAVDSAPEVLTNRSAARSTTGALMRAMTDVASVQAEPSLAPAQGRTKAELVYPVSNTLTIRDRQKLLLAGSVIPCTLQTSIDSTLPGLTGCIVSRPVLSADGRDVLIARGALVTGEYRSSAVLGQDRLMVVWRRLTTPDGRMISIESPSTDTLGAAGIRGEIDEHWRDRIGAALLLSVIQDGLSYVATPRQSGEGQSTIVMPNTLQSGNSLAAKVLDSTIGIAPTLTVRPGTRLSILVARDLHFDDARATTTGE